MIRKAGITIRKSARGSKLAVFGREERRIAAPAFDSPPFEAPRKDLHEVGPRQRREAKARHARSAGAFARPRRQPFEIGVKAGIVHFDEISAASMQPGFFYIRSTRAMPATAV